MSHYASNELHILFRVKIYEVESPAALNTDRVKGVLAFLKSYHFTLASLFFTLYMETTKTSALPWAKMYICGVSDVLANFRSGYFMQVKTGARF